MFVFLLSCIAGEGVAMARTWGLGLEKLTNANLRNFAEMMLCDTSRLGNKTKKEELLKLVYGKLAEVFIEEEEEPESAEGGGGGNVVATVANLGFHQVILLLFVLLI